MPHRTPLSARHVLCALDDATEPEGISPLCERLRRRGCSARTIDVLWYLEELQDLSLVEITPYTEREQDQLIQWLRHIADTLGEEDTETDQASPPRRYVISKHGRALLRVDHDAEG